MRTKSAWKRVNVNLLNYNSVKALRYEPIHTRLLLWSPKGPPFWAPTCCVYPCSRLSDGRIIGTIDSDVFTPDRYINILNCAAVDYTRLQMVKLLDFLPMELQSGQPFRFQYQFLLRGRNERQ